MWSQTSILRRRKWLSTHQPARNDKDAQLGSWIAARSYAVTLRTREIGIRMALGAERRDVLTLVLRQGLALLLAGEALGLAGALACNRALSSMVFGIATTDPATYGAVTLAWAAVALCACWVPARRAARVDPMVALRYE